MKEIESKAFNNASYLKFFDLDYNKLTTIYANTFSIHSLEELDLSFNYITITEPKAFDGSNNLHNLNLNGNKLNGI